MSFRYKIIRISHKSFSFFLYLETADNFRYASGEHEHTAGYDATCTAICMTKMMAYIAEKTEFKGNPMDHTLINTFTGK